jgi:tetratricopeptide (TPR) repeat protein
MDWNAAQIPFQHLWGAKSGIWELEAFYENMLELHPRDAYWYRQAGEYYHQKITRNPVGYIFPDERLETSMEGLTSDDWEVVKEFKRKEEFLDERQKIWLGIRISFTDPVRYPNKRANQILNRAVVLQKTDEDMVNVNYWLADLYRLNGKTDSAIFFYSVALNTAPKNASVRLGLLSYLHENNYLFESYQLLDTLHMQGQLLFAQRPLYTTMSIYANQLDSAAAMLAWLQQSRFIDKDSLALLRGNLYFLQSNPRKAIAFTKDSLQHLIPDGERYYRMAALYAASGQQKDAINWLEKSLKSGFTYGHVLKYDPVWNTYNESGNWKKLVAKYEKGFKKYPVEEEDKKEGNNK